MKTDLDKVLQHMIATLATLSDDDVRSESARRAAYAATGITGERALAPLDSIAVASIDWYRRGFAAAMRESEGAAGPAGPET